MIIELIAAATVSYAAKLALDSFRDKFADRETARRKDLASSATASIRMPSDSKEDSGFDWLDKSTKRRQMLFDRTDPDKGHFTFTPEDGDLHATFGTAKKTHNFLGYGSAGESTWKYLPEMSGLERKIELNTVHESLPESAIDILKLHQWSMPKPHPTPKPKTDYEDFMEKYYSKYTKKQLGIADSDESEKDVFKLSHNIGTDILKLLDSLPKTKSEEPKFFGLLQSSEKPSRPSVDDWTSPVLSPARDRAYDAMIERRKEVDEEISRKQAQNYREHFLSGNWNIEGEVIESMRIRLPAPEHTPAIGRAVDHEAMTRGLYSRSLNSW